MRCTDELQQIKDKVRTNKSEYRTATGGREMGKMAGYFGLGVLLASSGIILAWGIWKVTGSIRDGKVENTKQLVFGLILTVIGSGGVVASIMTLIHYPSSSGFRL